MHCHLGGTPPPPPAGCALGELAAFLAPLILYPQSPRSLSPMCCLRSLGYSWRLYTPSTHPTPVFCTHGSRCDWAWLQRRRQNACAYSPADDLPRHCRSLAPSHPDVFAAALPALVCSPCLPPTSLLLPQCPRWLGISRLLPAPACIHPELIYPRESLRSFFSPVKPFHSGGFGAPW